MSPFVPLIVSHCVKALPAVNYSLILPASLLLFVSFVCYRSIASHSRRKRDHLSSKSPKTCRFVDGMYNYFKHQREAMTQLDPNIKPAASTEQPYDVFLVLDVEATCLEGGEWSQNNNDHHAHKSN